MDFGTLMGVLGGQGAFLGSYMVKFIDGVKAGYTTVSGNNTSSVNARET